MFWVVVAFFVLWGVWAHMSSEGRAYRLGVKAVTSEFRDEIKRATVLRRKEIDESKVAPGSTFVLNEWCNG